MIWKYWKIVGHKIGNFQARLILSFFYFVLVCPFAAIVRFGSKPLRLKIQDTTNWLAHVSSTFHGQCKGQNSDETYGGGYTGDSKEVSAPYLLHQDFTGANIPTSPSALTLWAGVNSWRSTASAGCSPRHAATPSVSRNMAKFH